MLPQNAERGQKTRNYASILTNAPYSIWMAAFIVVPMLFVGYYAFTDTEGSFSISNFAELSRFSQNFIRSLIFALSTTAITFVIAYPFAYFISRKGKLAQRIMIMMVLLPMWTNLLIRTQAWRSILASNGLLNNLLGMIGLGPLTILNTPTAVVIGLVYNYLPFMIIPLYTVMTRMDQSLLEAASDLGANGWKKFRHVIFPMTMPGVVAGVMMVFVPSLSTFYVARVLGGVGNLMIGDIIAFEMRNNFNYNLGATMSLVLMVIVFASMGILKRFASKEAGGKLH